MKITTVIVDDESLGRQTLREMLHRYCNGVEVVGEAWDVESAIKVINEYSPNLVLLDISMPNGSGFDLLNSYYKAPFEVIFITAHQEYALQAIRMCALDYLLKPVSIQELIEAIHRARERMEMKNSISTLELLKDHLKGGTQNNGGKLVVPSQDGLTFLPLSEIIRLEADGSYTRIYLQDGSMVMSTRLLKEYEEMLPQWSFFRPHHSYIINLDQIRQYVKGDGGHVIMSDSSTVYIAKRRKKDFLERFQV